MPIKGMVRTTALVMAMCLVSVFLATPSARGQGSRKDDIVFGPSGHPIAGATVTVCVATATGTPCAPLATLYIDATLTVTAPNPFQADGIGNYHFYAPAGRYQVQISGPQVSGTITFPDVILPADLSSTSSGNNISAFGLTLGGNLNVAGNATITGTLTSGTFSPGTFAPTSITVGGSETVLGPRPRVDVTAYGAKGDGTTDDTSAINSAITASCNTTLGSSHPDLYFPPGTYAVTQTQLPSTAGIFEVPCSNIKFVGLGSSGTASFGRAGVARIMVTTVGSNPNLAAVFDVRYPNAQSNVTFENLQVTGYNRGIEIYTTNDVVFQNVTVTAAITGSTDNHPLVMSNNFWFEWHGGDCLFPGTNTLYCVLMKGDIPLGSEAPLVGLAEFDNLQGAGGGFQYSQRVNTNGSGPGNLAFRDIRAWESIGTAMLYVSNDTGNAGTAAMPQFSGLIFDAVNTSDATNQNNALVEFNSSGSVLGGVVITQPSTGNAGAGVTIRMDAGSLTGCYSFGLNLFNENIVVDSNGNPIGSCTVSNSNGFDYAVNTSDAGARLRTDVFGLQEIGSAFRAFAGGSRFAAVGIDPANGFMLNGVQGFGWTSSVKANSVNSLDIQFANILPPTNVAATPTTGGGIAAGTYYVTVSSTSDNCTTQSAPSIQSSAVTLSGSNNAISVSWTLPATSLVSPSGFCITAATTPNLNGIIWNPGTSQKTFISGGTTTSTTLTALASIAGTNPLISTLAAAHRFTPTSLGINNTNPQYNLDVNGSAAVNSLNQVQKAERFSGADAAAKLNACLAAAATTSSLCDARGLTGTLTGASHLSIPAGTILLWGQAQLTITDTATNDAIELSGDGASIYGYQESGITTLPNTDNSGYIACAVAGCTTVKKPNQSSSKINFVHIVGMYLQANGANSKVIDLTSVGHSVVESNNLALGIGGNSYGIFGDSSTGDFDSTNTLIRHNNIGLNSTGDTCFSFAGIYNAMVVEQNVCTLAPAASYGYVLKKDSNGNYPDNDEIYGNDCESSSQAFGQICYNIIGALSVTLGPNNRCENVYNCVQFPTDGSANGIHLLDPYLSLSNANQVNPNEPATATVAIDNNGHNWLPSMHYGQNDLAGPNLLGNAGFEGWQNSTTLYYWGGASGTNINQAGSGIYVQEASAGSDPGVDSFTQGTYNVRVGDGATAGLGVNSGCIQVDPLREYTLMFRVASSSTSNNFRPGFRFYYDPNCTEADKITSVATNARVLAPTNYASNLQSTNASLTYNNGITCNCNVTGADWQVSTANTWTVNRNYGIVFRVPNAFGNSSTVAHSMRIFLLENTAAANNYVYFDDAILSQGPASPDIRPAALADSGNGGTVNGYSNYNFSGTVSLQSNTANVGTFAHSITANRTWTLPDAAGPVIVQTGSTPINNDCAQFSVSGSTVTIKDSGGACASTGALASWGLQHAGSGQSFSSNAVKVWGIIIPYAVNYSHIDYDVSTLDSSTSDFYDLGLYGPCAVNTSSCPLVTHIGAQNLTASGYKQASVTSGTIQPGLYWVAMTGNATTAQLATTSVSEWTVCPSTNSSTTSSSGALPSTIATPNCSAPQWTGAAVVSIGFE